MMKPIVRFSHRSLESCLLRTQRSGWRVSGGVMKRPASSLGVLSDRRWDNVNCDDFRFLRLKTSNWNTPFPTSIDMNVMDLSPCYNNQQQIYRTMVTVTKTKSSDLVNDMVADDPDDGTSVGENSYVVQSDALIVTDSCLNRVEKLITQRKQKEGSEEGDDTVSSPYFLRVFVDAGGCSGFQYQFEIASDYDEDEDVIIVSSSTTTEPRVVVDETSLGFLEGSTLDYVIEMIKSSFTIRDNPKSESACGCGSSFAVKNFEANPALD